MTNNISFGKKAAITALFAALVCAGCFIYIPIPGGIPIAVQDMLAMLCGLILGPIYGTAAVFIFLLLGCVGIPVFTGKAGIQVILTGPSGGFLVGYLVSALVSGLIVHFFVKDYIRVSVDSEGNAVTEKVSKKQNILNWVFIAVAAIVATVLVFVLGILGFKRIKPDFEFSKILAAVLIPFIPGNILKLIIMVPVAKKIRPVIHNYANI